MANARLDVFVDGCRALPGIGTSADDLSDLFASQQDADAVSALTWIAGCSLPLVTRLRAMMRLLDLPSGPVVVSMRELFASPGKMRSLPGDDVCCSRRQNYSERRCDYDDPKADNGDSGNALENVFDHAAPFDRIHGSIGSSAQENTVVKLKRQPK